MSALRVSFLAAVAIVTGACHRARRFDPAEAALAAAASDSLTVALADSIAPAGPRFVTTQAGGPIESITACEDHVDSHGWQSFASSIIELELPEGYTGSSQTRQLSRWSGPGGWLRASTHSGDAHVGWTGLITSECDVFISGSPAHVDLVNTGYGRGVHVLIKGQDAPDIGIEAQATTIGGQAQLLHAIRTARVSSAWGRPE